MIGVVIWSDIRTAWDLLDQKDVIWVIWMVIWMVIWSDIRTVWGPVSSKRCVLDDWDGHLTLYTNGLGVFLGKKL